MTLANPIHTKFPFGSRLLLLVLVALSLNACKKDEDDPEPTPQQNLVELAQADTSLSLLVEAVVRAGLDDDLAATTTNGYTLFAPTNKAFRTAGLNSSVIAATSPEALSALLRYHVLPVEYTTIAITKGEYKTLADDSLTVRVSKIGGNLFVNGNSLLTTLNKNATNGIMQVVDDVILLPTGNLFEIVESDTSFTLLSAAIDKAGLVDALSDPDVKYTLFAPTDEAFNDAGYANVAAIQAADSTDLANLLLYHVAVGRYYGPEIPSAFVTSLEGSTFTTTPLSSVTVKGTGNTSVIPVVTLNRTASNGVIHTIESLMLLAVTKQ